MHSFRENPRSKNERMLESKPLILRCGVCGSGERLPTIHYNLVSCRIISYHIRSDHTTSYHITSDQITSDHVASHHIAPHRVASRRVASHRIDNVTQRYSPALRGTGEVITLLLNGDGAGLSRCVGARDVARAIEFHQPGFCRVARSLRRLRHAPKVSATAVCFCADALTCMRFASRMVFQVGSWIASPAVWGSGVPKRLAHPWCRSRAAAEVHTQRRTCASHVEQRRHGLKDPAGMRGGARCEKRSATPLRGKGASRTILYYCSVLALNDIAFRV